jgi:hypothetical protein
MSKINAISVLEKAVPGINAKVIISFGNGLSFLLKTANEEPTGTSFSPFPSAQTVVFHRFFGVPCDLSGKTLSGASQQVVYVPAGSLFLLHVTGDDKDRQDVDTKLRACTDFAGR